MEDELEEIKELATELRRFALQFAHPDNPDLGEWGGVHDAAEKIEEIAEKLLERFE